MGTESKKEGLIHFVVQQKHNIEELILYTQEISKSKTTEQTKNLKCAIRPKQYTQLLKRKESCHVLQHG